MRRSAAVLLVIAIVCCGRSPALGQPAPTKNYHPYPKPDAGYVTDLADVLSAEQEERIEQWLWQAEEQTGTEIVVVTLDSVADFPGSANGTIEAFAAGLFDAYGIGNLPANDGVLLVVAVKDRDARIELGAGYGRSRDADAARIMQNQIIPAFKRRDYPGGITEGVATITDEFAGLRLRWDRRLIFAAVALPVLGLVAFSLFKNGKRGWGWVVVGLIVVIIIAVFQVLWQSARYVRDHTDFDSGGGGGSGSWSSGGFGGGFGGGFSGGGGASGSW